MIKSWRSANGHGSVCPSSLGASAWESVLKAGKTQQARLELLRINADLGRLGGLLKRALAEGHDKAAVIRLLRQIDQTQANLKEKVRAL